MMSFERTMISKRSKKKENNLTQEGKSPVTCQDLIEKGEWLKRFCCEDCHADAAKEGDEIALIHCSDFVDGGLRYELLCCRASALIHPSGLPSHESEVPGVRKLKWNSHKLCSNDKQDRIRLCASSLPDSAEGSDEYHVVYMPDIPGYNSIEFTCSDEETAQKLYSLLQYVSGFSIDTKYTWAKKRKINLPFKPL
jgi:hypothetical protein